MDTHITHSISLRSIFAFFLVGILFYTLYYLADMVLIVLSSIVIAASAEPAVRALTLRRVRRAFAATIVYFSFVGLFAVIGYMFIPALLEQTAQLVNDLPKYAAASSAVEFSAPVVGTISSVDAVHKLQELIATVSSNPFGALAYIFGGIVGLLLVFIFSFYFTMEEKGVEEFLRLVTPASNEKYVLDLWARVKTKIELWMQGQLLLGVIVGVLTFLLLTIFGIPHALVLSVLAGTFELIPLFGPTLSAFPAFGIAYAAGGISLGLVAIGIYVVIQQFENHLIYPLVVTKVVGVSPVMVILALAVGIKLAGFFGVLLAVPAAALIQEIAADIDKRRGAR
jgi:predicted PurR-regulated permease PerM